MFEGSVPLMNEKHESYASSRAKGVSQAEAFKSTIPFGTAYNGGNASLRVSGHRLEKRPDVKARIAYLRKIARSDVDDADKPLSRGEVVQISLEVSEALEATYKAARGSSVSPQALERLKAVLASHLARQGKIDDDAKPLDSARGDVETALIMRRIVGLGGCTCQAL